MLSLAVFEAATRVQSTHLIKSCLKTRKRKENMEIKDILHKFPSNFSFRHTGRIHFPQRRGDARERALTSFTYLTHIASLRVGHSHSGQKVGHA